MPSQEDYLDRLLNGMKENTMEKPKPILRDTSAEEFIPEELMDELMSGGVEEAFAGDMGEAMPELMEEAMPEEPMEPAEESMEEPLEELLPEEYAEYMEPLEELLPEEPMEAMEPAEESMEKSMEELLPEEYAEDMEPLEELLPEEPVEAMEPMEPLEELLPEEPVEAMEPMEEPMEELLPEEPLEAIEPMEPLEELLPEEPMEPVEDLPLEEPLTEPMIEEPAIDDLLAGIPEVEEPFREEAPLEGESGNEDLGEMTEDEIAKLLEESKNAEPEAPAQQPAASDDLLGKLDDASDDELISLLQAVSDGSARSSGSGISAGLEGVAPLVRKDMAGGEALRERDGRLSDKKRLKMEKKAARKAAKKAARDAKKARKAKKEQPELSQELVNEMDALMVDPSEIDESLLQTVEKIPEKKARTGFFARLLGFLTEEDEEEEDKGNEDVPISDENKAILEELDKEKGKKSKKKPKKGKKAKNAEEPAEGEEGGEGEEENKKGKKAKKEKKGKKEKGEQPEEQGSGKKLSLKKMLPIFMICLSLMLAIIICVNLTGDYSAKKAGREAYYEGDYQTCYQNLYGKDLNESEQVMFGKSESILRIRMWVREYEMLVQEGAELEALDSLIQSVNDYPKLYAFASEWNAVPEVSEGYQQILSALEGKYHLTEAQAQEIAAIKSDVEYTRAVLAAVQGAGFAVQGAPQAAGPSQPEVKLQPPTDGQGAGDSLPNPLPEEGEIGESQQFVDNRE